MWMALLLADVLLTSFETGVGGSTNAPATCAVTHWQPC